MPHVRVIIVGWINKIFRSSQGSPDAIAARELEGTGFAEWVAGGDASIVTPESAIAISAVWSCVRLISDTIRMLPVNLFERTDTGRQKITSHPAARILRKPNEYMTHTEFFGVMMRQLLLRGNSYARIVRDVKYRPIALLPYHPAEVSVTSSKGEIFYYLPDIFGPVPARDMIHLRTFSMDGIRGKSPITVHRENLSLAVNAQKYGDLFFKAGGNTEGIFEYPGALSPEAHERLKKQLAQRMAGIGNAHKPMLLEGGMKYVRINIPLEDAQFITTRKYQKNEIATIYGVPPHMIGDLDRATFSNIEHQAIEYVTYCLMPYAKSIEEEFASKLLYDSEQDGLYYSFGLNGILRGDQKSRGEFYRTMFYIGAMTPNEIRALEDMNGYEDGDEFFVQTNMDIIKNLSADGESGDGKKVPDTPDKP